MRAIDHIVAHYKRNETQYLDIAEWGAPGEPLRVYWKLLTVEERRKLVEYGRDDVDVVVKKALDEKGEKLFDAEDGLKLRAAADASIITRIADAMLRQGAITAAAVAEAEKN